MKKQNGFTLIELLAVISILTIIALIAVPIIIHLLENSKKDVFKSSAEGIVRAITLDSNNANYESESYSIENGSIKNSKGEKINSSGGSSEMGTANINEEGEISIVIYNKTWCAIKDYEDKKVTVKKYEKSSCKNLSASVIIKDKNTSGNTEGLFTDDFGNVRYRGNNSVTKNYVTFNDEVWRIIGVFDGKVKLIRDDRISNPNSVSIPNDFLWNTANTNDWSTSDLKDYLNGTYYNKLNGISKSMIEDTKYNLGGYSDSIYQTITKKEAYEKERGTEVYSGRPTEWTGKIALMYVSDYGYSAGEECISILYNYNSTSCNNNNWLHKGIYLQWTITPFSNVSSSAALVRSGGSVDSASVGHNWLSIRPVIYLKSNIKITSGDGTVSSPYLLN